ncbi:uncharacterized protein LOC119535985 [Choloepus didactylus]|uniref:uncharacterized protein LOC119535985 n=1 Tax=Choloepus didactylus TaxID=27675 RepID=UPI00189D6DB3|nr:uncharacterized protein LOC119535985 [Choloepus didactylus]XP_037694335.1 uncharacterized protein LOC119535985 [Choloepus didactylus]XP_037694337.1 uncharacterized protein LOC119535985 [Choloepus didactylus]XP_037694338.1 uncharacterized protein LOC119535985 [Choloepus didactylus]XP_037694339.1 uncharacterized protein LOC119535985 [Choloepus didactylus]XP_037694340.1 uncharacterized protein LOC119535985 [Choloepus didactylus]XP_037694341.1 uncharacterized protein LOC119535985 [Choloepus di
MREPWAKAHRKARGRDKARSQARASGRSPQQPGCRGTQMPREKMWVPWNGLVVIGKKVKLLGRITQKPRLWVEKLESEDWKPEAAQKTDLKVKSGPSRETMDVKLLHNVASGMQASAGLEKGTPRENWGKQEAKRKTGAESESSGTAPGSRRASGFEESLRSTGEKVGTRGEGMRSSGEKLGTRGEMRGSIGEKRSSGEKLGTSGEDLRSTGHKLGSWSGEELRLSAEKLGTKGDRQGSSGEKLRTSREKLSLSGEKLRLSGERLRLSREKLQPSGEKLASSGENLEPSGEDLRSTGDKLGSGWEKLGSSGERLQGSRIGSIREEEIKEVVEVTDEEVDTSERVEGNDEELVGTAEGVEVEGDGLQEVKDITDESVSMAEKEVIGEGTSE